MFNLDRTERGKELATLFRTALLVTVLGLAVVAIEQPRLSASPNGQRATADAILHPAVVVDADAATNERDAAALLPASASEYALVYGFAGAAAGANIASKTPESESPTPYFPAQFAPPTGEPEPQPPTF
jgi:hypothetical protein